MAFGGLRSSCVRPGAHSAQRQNSRNDWTPYRMAGPFVSAGAHASHSARRLAPSLSCAPPTTGQYPKQELGFPFQLAFPDTLLHALLYTFLQSLPADILDELGHHGGFLLGSYLMNDVAQSLLIVSNRPGSGSE